MDCEKEGRYGNPEYHEWLPYETYTDKAGYKYVIKVFCRWCLKIKDIKDNRGIKNQEPLGEGVENEV